MDNDELSDLLARCSLKDQKALEQLYEKVAPYLNGVAYRILGASDDSNDVLQEAFVQIWNNAANFNPAQANPLTWMSSIVRYRAIDKLRQEQRHVAQRPHQDSEAEILQSIPGAHTQEDIQQQFMLNKQLKKCLDLMNDKFRKSVELAYLYGYSREELAESLDTNVNTIKSWLHRGVAKLKLCLEGQYDEHTDR